MPVSENLQWHRRHSPRCHSWRTHDDIDDILPDANLTEPMYRPDRASDDKGAIVTSRYHVKDAIFITVGLTEPMRTMTLFSPISTDCLSWRRTRSALNIAAGFWQVGGRRHLPCSWLLAERARKCTEYKHSDSCMMYMLLAWEPCTPSVPPCRVTRTL